jgi:hypothetical protein
VRAVPAGDPGLRQRGQEGLRAVEGGHLQVGRAHAVGVVRVRARPGGQAVRRGQRGRLLVPRLVGDLGVEHLDHVHVALLA